MEALLLIWLALTVFAGAFVVVDIAYNVMTVSALGLFVLFGLRLDGVFMHVGTPAAVAEAEQAIAASGV